MKREEILFYLSNDKVRMYFLREEKDYTYEIDTSSFFKYGDIYNVELCDFAITEILTKINFSPFHLKPNLYVLYNNVSACDTKFLYSHALRSFNYNFIRFIPLTGIVKRIKSDQNIVVFDKNYYTLIDRGEKILTDSDIEIEEVLIGRRNPNHVHYSDDDIIWDTCKSYFTKEKKYDIMSVGDDEF
jgi:hypothetical protein